MRLKDIAEQAGVSISTVSRVLSDPYTSAASKETQNKIWEIAVKNGYTPNQTARTLKKGSFKNTAQPKRSIYCMIATASEEHSDDPFYTSLISSVRLEALQHNFISEYTFTTPDMEKFYPKDKSSSGLVIIGRFRPQLLKELKDHFKHIIYIGLNNIEANCDQVICDGYIAAQEVIQYYHDNGHQHIGFIGTSDDMRLDGYKVGLKNNNITIRSDYVIDDITLSVNGGYNGAKRLLERGVPVSAIFCSNDMTAIGALRACKDMNIQVPDDISIIGMIDIEMIRYVSPTLSSIYVPLSEMGKMAAKLLVDRINGGHSIPVKVNYPFHIVARQSFKQIL